MRYWPLSVIRMSPLLPGDCAAELDALYTAHKLSHRAFGACGFVASKTKPIMTGNMVVMEGDETVLPKVVYVGRPTVEQWGRFERAIVVKGPAGPDHYVFVMEMLH